MRSYELVLVLRPSLNEKDREKLLKTVKDWLKDVKISKEDVWGQKPLAYKIKREVAGYYVKYDLEADPSASSGQGTISSEFEKRLINDENIIRHLLLRTK